MRVVHGRRWAVGLVLAAGLAVGCNKGCAKPTSAADSPVAPAAATPDDKAAKDVSVSVVKYPALEEAVTKHKGKVVLVDFWADFCTPCKKKFPYVVELHEKYADKGLVVVSVSLDDPEDKANAHKFLAANRAVFTNVLIKPTSAEEKLMAAKFGYDGTLPQMALFGKSGDRTWDWNTKPISEKDLKKYAAKVEELVKVELAK